MGRFIKWFDEVGIDDVELVGGKCASLGEMISNLVPQGIRVPNGFAVSAAAYRHFVAEAGLEPVITDHIVMLQAGESTLQQAGRAIRTAIVQAPWPDDLAAEVREAYAELSRRDGIEATDVAVRSSATAEDLPDASFAGQQDTYLNVMGTDAVLDACRRCFASLFTDRAITYRRHQGFDHLEVALAIAVQKMVRSDRACAGTMFTLDTETGFPDVVVIDASWGLGESVVGGHVTPDEYRVFKGVLDKTDVLPVIEKRLGAKQTKLVYAGEVEGHTERVRTPKSERDQFTLTDEEAVELARWAVKIEQHYGRPMDIEWARDGITGQLFLTQARPETVHGKGTQGATLQTWTLHETGEVLVEGVAVGHGIAAGNARVLYDPADAANHFQEGEVLVTPMTDPDWVPLMEKASAIVTDAGGRTSHAAIISRELGVPAIVGCGDATRRIETGDLVTVSCAEGDRGHVYEGRLRFESSGVDTGDLPETKTDILMIVGSPQTAYRWWRVPCEGVGLARMEFIINNVIRVHPLALLHFDELEDDDARYTIERITRGYDSKPAYFVDKLSRAMAGIAAAFAGVSGGFSANLTPGQLDALLFGITETAVVNANMDPSWTVNLAGNAYFIFGLLLIYLPIIWWVTDTIIEPRLQKSGGELDVDHAEDAPKELSPEQKKGLWMAGGAVLAVIALWTFMTIGPGTPLIDETQCPAAAAEAGECSAMANYSPFFKSLVGMFLVIFLAAGWVYGAAATGAQKWACSVRGRRRASPTWSTRARSANAVSSPPKEPLP